MALRAIPTWDEALAKWDYTFGHDTLLTLPTLIGGTHLVVLGVLM